MFCMYFPALEPRLELPFLIGLVSRDALVHIQCGYQQA